MSTRENIRLIARTPYRFLVVSTGLGVGMYMAVASMYTASSIVVKPIMYIY